ncbi:hypothetical protein F3Y22_tig00110109pilonHSYRG00135 [Hibiscus syriacus]|uniref:Uncharacterized protein n=1 Tax=Hibiscus syriacus TaxID=106335 RepID=A0A6A3BNU0_HIBSY|nr:uncharacterized protein LOC120214931 [Hibiscus syriacus]KAE8716762.1 hypothetical protein F3Y22_tig00110109pilonHSYRG00135 [Hibiscus syriacus]
MASLQISNPVFSSISISQSNFPGKSESRNRILKFQRCRSRRSLHSQRSRICCATEEGDNRSNGEEPTESLFMKELKRRGMTPNSLLEDTKKPRLDEEMKVGEEGGSVSKRNAVSTEFDKSLSNQRERSMELNSEGLEGLIPRAKLLLTLGGTFFLSFWPFILATIVFFSALYLYFGSSFIHDGSITPVAPPQYIDPYTLLEDERIYQTPPDIN